MNINNKNEIEHKIKQTEIYVNELENKLYDFNCVVAVRDEVQGKMCAALKMLDSIKIKQIDLFNELICNHNELSHSCTEEREQLIDFQNENDYLCSENKQINDELDKQVLDLEKLEVDYSNAKEENERLQRRLSEMVKDTNNAKRLQRSAELDMKDKDQEIVRAKNTIAEKITLNCQLEKKFTEQQEICESLMSSISELKMENGNTIRLLQGDLTRLQGQLNEDSAKLAKIKRDTRDQLEEVEKKKDNIEKLKIAYKKLGEFCEKDKIKTDRELGNLRDEVNSMVADITYINKKLCDAQDEGNKLKFKLEDQDKAIKCMTSTNEQLQQEISRIKKATEFTTKIFLDEREQHAAKIKIMDRKLELQAQEECELKRLFKKQTEKINRKKKEIFENSLPNLKHVDKNN